MENSGKLDLLSPVIKTEIYDYIKDCIYINGSGEAHSFKEFPLFNPSGYGFYKLYGLPVELSGVPKNVSDYCDFGKGIHQTYGAFRSLILLDLFSPISYHFAN